MYTVVSGVNVLVTITVIGHNNCLVLIYVSLAQSCYHYIERLLLWCHYHYSSNCIYLLQLQDENITNPLFVNTIIALCQIRLQLLHDLQNTDPLSVEVHLLHSDNLSCPVFTQSST